MDSGYRIDLLVENTVIVEIKCVEALLPIHKAQLLTYLRLANKALGLLLNFNVVHLREGIKRVLNNKYQRAIAMEQSGTPNQNLCVLCSSVFQRFSAPTWGMRGGTAPEMGHVLIFRRSLLARRI
jgi:hypothetical protein